MFTQEKLATLVSRHLEIEPGRVAFRPIRSAQHNAGYRVHTPVGDFILRIAPPDDAPLLFYERRMMWQEPTLHRLIRARTSIPVAEVVAYDFSRTLIDRDYVLLEALPGLALSEVTTLNHRQFNRALTQVGEYLGQLHELTAGAFGYLGEHRPMKPQPTWWAAFELMWDRLLEDVAACGWYSAQEARAMREVLAAHREFFQGPAQAHLLHMEVWSQNILIDPEGNVTGLLDFDRALWGDPELEFAVLDYYGVSASAFWEGYPVPRPFDHAAQIRRRFYLLYEMQKYMPLCTWRADDAGEAQSYKQNCQVLASRLLSSV